MSSRDEFESHPKFKGMDFTRNAKHPEYYESPYANGAWEGWQACRAQVIELPKWCGTNHERMLGLRETEKALIAQGLKVVPQ